MSIQKSSPAIVWLRNDLRLSDNPALYHAQELPVIVIYVYDPKDPRSPGGAGKWWLHHSLEVLAKDLAKQKIPLLLKWGDPEPILLHIVKQTEAQAIYWNRKYDAYSIQRDSTIKEALTKQGITCRSYNGSLLAEPWELKPTGKQCYKVFTPFWKALVSSIKPSNPLTLPKLQPYSGKVASDMLMDWQLLPSKPNWAKAFSTHWQPGEAGALARLKKFLDDSINHYKTNRNVPAYESTSRLSPSLHWGEISPRQIWHAVGQQFKGDLHASAWNFLSELGWREFSYHLLYHFPRMPTEPLREEFANFPWKQDKNALKAWQQGMTGYPIVDAGMQQLWQTGWLHNRLRMIVASFLVKDLLIPWQDGEQWFWDTLVDADPANNTAGWQWVSGCGADAAPYFRIFNPILQGKKFDPEGDYVKQWIPALKELSSQHIHAPWDAPAQVLQEAGIILGKTYPNPIVDHSKARTFALEAFKNIKKD